MSLTRKDFFLSSLQICRINEYFSKMATAHLQAGEGPWGSIRIEFEWVPALGRSVTAYFDSAVDGFLIEGFEEV